MEKRPTAMNAPTLSIVCAIGLCSLVSAVPDAAAADEPRAAPTPKVRLVLQITVDQLRGDMLDRYAPRFGDGGFRRLLERGTVYTDAHYEHANTETIVGHATLATGATPSVHGMVGNLWYDGAAGRVVYNIEDDRYRLVGTSGESEPEASGPESVARSEGRSPAALLTSTLADELAEASAGRSRIFSVAVKDRAAVPMAGHAGKALWYSKRSGRFVSSTYYFPDAPAWLTRLNAARPANRYADTHWTLLAPKPSYLFRNQDDRPFESMMGLFGRTFPHALGNPDDAEFFSRLASSPAGDELIAELATTVLETQQLGQRKVVDYLAVGFSATDYVGHTFGPSSLEAEDNLLRLDRTVAKLLASVDKAVGLDSTLVVLSSDHGVAEAPEARRARGMNAERLLFDALESRALRDRIAERFDTGGADLVIGYIHPYLYLDRERMEKAGLAPADVQRFVAAQLSSIAGVERAVAAVDIVANARASQLDGRLAANHHPVRSGDVYVVARPYWLPYAGTAMRPMTATHGSPWSYDTHVPIIFMGPSIAAVRTSSRVSPSDIAPTISEYLGISAPAGATGAVLAEVAASRAETSGSKR